MNASKTHNIHPNIISKSDLILFECNADGVATVTLNNPHKHNAFDDNIIACLSELFQEIALCPDIHIMILAATGKSFCAGADLSWMKRMASYSYEDNLADANALATMLERLNRLPQTTIAKIQGAAFGGAVGLASCCDIVITNEHASFCLSEVKIGLIPATISPYVIKAIGEKACRRYFQTAERFFADKAMQLGLVDEIYPMSELDNAVTELVKKLLANSPAAIKQAKTLVFDFANKTIDRNIITQSSERIAAIRVSDEGQEGLNAFFDKRLPNWQLKNNCQNKKYNEGA